MIGPSVEVRRPESGNGGLGEEPLVERESELTVVATVRDALERGRGGLVVIEGPAGIGKSALLRRLAGNRSPRPDDGDAPTWVRPTWSTRGVQREQSFPFGMLMRLLTPHVGPTGGIAGCRPGSVGAPPPPDGLLHRLLCDASRASRSAAVVGTIADAVGGAIAPAAEGRIILIDDLQWADEASLAVLARIAACEGPGAGLLLAAAGRVDDARPARGALRTAATHVMEPAALSPAGIARLAGRMGRSRTAAEAEALHELSGGAPALVIAALRDDIGAGVGLEGVEVEVAHGVGGPVGAGLGTDPHVDVGPALTAFARQRLAELSPSERAVTEALSILDGTVTPATVAAVARLPAPAAAAATHRLAAAGITAPDGRTLCPPVLQLAVLDALGPARRRLLHGRAAAAIDGDAPSRVAVHLLHAAGAPLALDPVPDRFAEAQALTTDVAVDAWIAVRRAEALIHAGRTTEADDVVHAARERLPAAGPAIGDLRLQLDAVAHAARSARGDIREPSVPARLLEGPADTPGERAIVARLAWTLAITGTAPAVRVADLARRALGGTALLDAVGPSSPTFAHACSALIIAGDPDSAATIATAAQRHAIGSGSSLGLVTALALRGQAEMARGAPSAAASAVGDAARQSAARRTPPFAVAMAGAVAAAIVLATPQTGRAALRAHGLDAELADLGPVHQLMVVRGRLALAEGDVARALAEMQEVRRRAEPGYANPSSLPWRTTLALALAAAGERSAALDQLETALEGARAFGAPSAHGAVLRARGRIRGGPAGRADLQDAVDLLEGAP
ncbi:MAG: AAA family ATPase, partial [Solirubrobacteraceae bacterium]